MSMPAVVIGVAPNGARRGKVDHPRLPLTPAELAAEAEVCLAEGASMLHLHVRDGAGRHALDPALYRQALAAVRERVGERLLLQVSSEAAGLFQPGEQRRAMRELGPEALSVALREMLPEGGEEGPAAAFYQELALAGCLVQHIVYHPREAERLLELVARGLVPEEPASALFVLGAYGDRDASPADLGPMIEVWGDRGPWMVCAFGAAEGACMRAAAERGGHVRVGFENNLWRADGSLARSSAELVREAAEAAALLGLRLADAASARRLLGGRLGERTGGPRGLAGRS